MVQDQLYQQILEQSDDLIWMIDSNFHLIYANKAYLKLMKDVTGKDKNLNESVFVEGFGDGYIQKWQTYFERAFKGEQFEIEEHFYNPNLKEIKYTLVTFKSIIGDNEKVVAVTCQARDITPTVKDALKANMMLNASLDVFCCVNEDGNFTYVNEASTELWGYTPDELIGSAYVDYILEEDIPKTNEVAVSIMQGQKYTTFENRYRRKDGSIAYNFWSARWDDQEKMMYCVARDGREKLEQEELTLQSERRFRALVQEGSDMISIVDLNGKYKYTSPTTTAILGITPEEFQGKNIFDFIHPEDAERCLGYMQKIVTEKKLIVPPFRLLDSDKNWRWIESVITNMLDNPVVNGIVANSRDITEQIKEEQKLKLLESVVTNTTDSVLITEAEPLDEPGPKIIYVNEAFTKMTGYTAEEVIGKTPRILQGPNSNKEELEKLKDALRNWEPYEITIINYKKNGEEFWVNYTVTPVANEKGWYTHWIAIERDVTEQKNKELEKDLELTINSIFNNETDFFKSTEKLCETICDFGKFDWVELCICNKEKTKMHVFSHYLPNPDDEVFYEDSIEVKAFKKMEGLPGKVWAEKNQIFLSDFEKSNHFTRNKEALKIELKAVLGIPLIFNDELIGVLNIGTKNNEQYLKKYTRIFEHLESFMGSELKRKMLENDLSHLFDAVPDMISVGDFQGNFLTINKAGCELLGYTEEEILFKGFEKFVHPDDLQIAYQELQKLNEGQTTFNFEVRFITKQGSIIWLSWYCKSKLNEGLIYSTAKNITEEKKLRELNKQTRELAKIGSWEVDTVNQKLFWSEEVHKMHETDANTFVPTVETAINFYREDFREKVQLSIQNSIAKCEPFDFEAVIVTSKKKELWVRAVGNAEFVDGVCVRIYGSFQDINDHKETENMLLSFSENIPGVIYQYVIHPDGTESIQHISGMVEQLWGYSTKELMENINLLWNQIELGGDIDKVKASVHKSIQTKTKWTSRFKIVKPNGELKTHLGNSGAPIFLADGRIIFNVIVLDITKEAKNEDLLEEVTKLTKIGIWEMDLVKNGLFWSDQVHHIYETDPNTYNPSVESAINFYREDFREIALSSFEECVVTGEPYDIEAVIVTANNKEVWVRTTAKAEIVDGVCKRVYGSFQDINKRKQAEIEIQKSEAKFKSIFDIASLGIAQVNPLDGKVIIVNSYYETITGYTNDELLKMNFLELTHPEDRKKDWELFSKAALGEQEYRNEKRYIKKDGNVVWVKVHVAFIRDEKNKPIRTVAICEDITEQKDAEQRLNSLADNLPGVVFQYTLYPNGTDALNAVSAGAIDIWGYTADEVMENNNLIWNQTKEGGDLEEVQKSISNSIKTKSKWSAKWKYVMLNGELKTHVGYGSPIFLVDGTVVFNSVILDVTLETKNQELLEETNRIAKLGSWEIDLLDQKEDELYLSNMVKEILEVDDSFIPTLNNGLEFYNGANKDKVDKAIQNLIETGLEFDEEIFIRTAKGNTKWVRIIGKSLRVDNKCIKIYGSFQDIQELKEAQEERNSLLVTIENSLNEIYIFDDKTYQFSYINKGALQNLGYSENEILSLTPLDIKPDFTMASFNNLLSPLLNDEKSKIIFFTSHQRKDGSLYPVEVHLQLATIGDQKRFVAITLDITERKKAEELLKQASEIARLGSWEKDLTKHEGDNMYWSPMIKEILEVDDDYETTLNGGFAFAIGESYDLIKQSMEILINEGVEFDEEILTLTAKRKKRWVRVIGKSERINGVCNKIYGSFQDINETKVAEEERNSFQKTLENSLNEIYTFDTKTLHFNYVNNGALLNLGYSENEIQELTPLDLKPDYNLTSFNQLIKPLLNGEKEKIIFFTNHKRKNGSLYPVEVHLQLIKNDNNDNFLAIILDITERKKAEQEIKFKANLLSTIGQAVIATDLNGVVNYWNKAAEDIYGWTMEEAIGQNIVDLTTPGPNKEQAMQIMAKLKKGDTWMGNFKVHKKDRTEFTALVSNSPVYNEDKVLSGIIGVSSDVTQQIKNEELLIKYTQQLESSNERFEKVTEATNDVIWDWDLVQKTFYRSNAIESFFGKEASKLINETDFWNDSFHPDDLVEVKNSVDKAISDPSCSRWEAEYRIINYKKEILYVIDRGIILRDNNDKAIRMIGAMTNITEQKNNEILLKKLYNRLEKHTVELQRSNEELEQFAFITSHDLQEPLRMISSFMELLERRYKDELDDKAIQYIHFAVDGAKRMKQIILDLLLYSRANKPSEKIDRIDLNELITDYIQLRRNLISEKKGTIHPSNLPVIDTYTAPITQIFHCLLDNALKYSKVGVPPQIQITCVEKKLEWEFAISDNGIGIAPKYHEKIFVIFQRLHNRDSFTGSGIGLSIAKRSVEFLKGRIWLKSKEGEGTTFYFTIPKKDH